MPDQDTCSMPKMTCPCRRPVGIVAVIVVIVAVIVAIKFGRHHVFAKRFEAVVPGELYRSGELEAGPLERVIGDHQIKTVLTLLNDEPDSPDQQQEAAILAEHGVETVRIGMPGDGCADFDLLDQAAAVIADDSRRPLLVHCAAGVHRTGASYAAWRMRYQGWTLDQALEELADHWVTERSQPELLAHLRRYYDERIKPLRDSADETGDGASTSPGN